MRLFPDGADFLVLDKNAPAPARIIFHEAEEKGKGITAIPTTEGNLLLGPTQRPLFDRPYATAAVGLEELLQGTTQIFPELDLSLVIRSFGGVRPNPHRVVLRDGVFVPDGKSIGSFVIEHPAPGFLSLIGVKTPGLTCANELGRYAADKIAEDLCANTNDDFSRFLHCSYQASTSQY